MKKLFLILYLGIALIAVSAQTKYESRDQIPEKYKWNFSDIYENWEQWKEGYAQFETMMNELIALKGTLKNSSEALFKVFKLQDDMNMLSYKVYRYPQLQRDVDLRNQDIASKFQEVSILFAKLGTATSWINPEMLEIPWETMKQWLDANESLKPYRFGIEDLYRQQKHVLDADKEKLLSYFSTASGMPKNIYADLSTADIEFPTIKLLSGEERKMSPGNYSLTLSTSKSQEERKMAFEAHYNVYKENENTYASIYNSVLQTDWANAQARNYTSSIESYLEGNNVPIAVYESLVNTAKKNAAPLQKFYELRKKVLGLDKYHVYDGSVDLTEYSKLYDYDEASKWVLESVAPLGSEYQTKMGKAFEGGWIDVYETDGKRGGAYSGNCYGVHPYMLMNFNGILDNVFTLGHELGHTMHTVYANENQPFATASYTIFVAEVASTFNENLLLDYMLKESTDPLEKITLLTQAIDNIVGTFYTQAMFADFELQAHRLVEDGNPITAKVLTQLMKDIYLAYYGASVEEDELLYSIWTRIPHFYRTPFYVYQYATCYASSAQLYQEFQAAENKEEVLARYLNLLKEGGSDYPMEILKHAGIDLTKHDAFVAVTQLLDRLVTQLETELEAVK